MMRHLWLPPLGMLFCVFVAACLIAQEPAAVDPFGESKEAPKAAPASAEKKKTTAENTETDPIVLGIRAANPKTPPEVMQAAINLANYGRADEAKRFISALIQTKLDDSTCWQLQRKFGSAPYFRLSSQPDLQPEGKQLADIVLNGAHKFVRDPARLDSLIRQLNNSQLEVRHAAFVDLQEAASDAVVAIVKVLGDSSRVAEHPTLRTALVQMGHVSVGPLLGALDARQEELRSQVIVVLGRLQVTEAVPFLLRPFLTSATGSPEQRTAEAALLRMTGELPTRAAAERTLFSLVTDYFNGLLPGKPDHENRIEMWRWDEAEQRPVRERLDTIAAPVLFAARLASELIALAPENREYQRLQIAAVLESAKLATGWEQPLARGAGTPFELAASHKDSWDEVLRFTLDKGHIAAAVAMLEVIGAAGDAAMVRSSGGQPREVVKALRHPHRRVQFAALQAILRLAPREPYAGASYLPEALGYFARTAGSRRVLIAHPRIEIAQTLAGIFREFGIDSELTSSGTQAFQLAQSNSDFEFALLSDGLDRPNVQEQVRQFRREPRTAGLPIGVLARSENFDRLRRALEDDAKTEVFAQSTEMTGVSFALRRLLERADRDSVPHDERMRQAAAALDLLAILAENPQVYGFYELLPQQAAVELALTVPSLAVKAARVLGLLASPQAQRSLILLANQTGRQLSERQAAAAAFNVAVKRRGLLLTRTEILRQYDNYNESATSDAGTQQVLGTILDTIETPTTPPAAASGASTPQGES